MESTRLARRVQSAIGGVVVSGAVVVGGPAAVGGAAAVGGIAYGMTLFEKVGQEIK